MALLFRVCVGKQPFNGLFNRLCKVPKYSNVQVAHISGKVNRVKRCCPEPFPYQERDFHGLFHDYYYSTRYDENTKIIVVEGPIAAGKDQFARELARQLEMGYMPPPSFDLCFTDYSGFDIRKVDHVLPENAQVIDIERFLTNPKHKNVPAFQAAYYMLKYEAYIESMLHLLSTGEGVVLNRSVCSDFVFMKAMYNAGYIDRACHKVYEKLAYVTSRFIKKPHLVIYLDVPVKLVEERIKKRCIPYEVNSEVLTTKYLTDIETIYKEEYLPMIENHSYVLMYDWSCGGEIEDIVEDIERLDYDRFTYQFVEHTQQLKDWIFDAPNNLEYLRIVCSRQYRHLLLQPSDMLISDSTEMILMGSDLEKRRQLIEENISKYAKGYNPDAGDKVLFKTKSEACNHGIPTVISNKDL